MITKWTRAQAFISVFAAAIAVSSIFGGQALAHPHEFVEMKVEVKFDAQGKVSGFRYSWLFDEFFSAYALEGQDANKNGESEQSELDSLMTEILGNIHRIDYFTKFDENGVVPEVDKAVPVAATLKKRKFLLTFDVPLKEAVEVNEKPLRYAIYDDEFYIAMNHDNADGSISLSNAPAGCKWDLRTPDPDEDVAAFASSLDKTESGGSDLGINFAEWVAITCK